MKKSFQLSALLFVFALAVIKATAGYNVGDVVQDFSLKNTDGSTVSLASMKSAKGFIVVFTCNHCPYSVAYEDRIIELNQKYAKSGFPVVAINPNDATIVPEDSYDKMIVRAKEKSFNFPYLHDANQEIAKRFGATRTPHIFVVVKEDKGFVVRYIGAIDDNSQDAKEVKNKYVENAIEAIAKGSVPNPESTKAIGCSIKWSKK
jgi:peroxiredoxin